jgi:hypothetical protein
MMRRTTSSVRIAGCTPADKEEDTRGCTKVRNNNRKRA